MFDFEALSDDEHFDVPREAQSTHVESCPRVFRRSAGSALAAGAHKGVDGDSRSPELASRSSTEACTHEGCPDPGHAPEQRAEHAEPCVPVLPISSTMEGWGTEGSAASAHIADGRQPVHLEVHALPSAASIVCDARHSPNKRAPCASFLSPLPAVVVGATGEDSDSDWCVGEVPSISTTEAPTSRGWSRADSDSGSCMHALLSHSAAGMRTPEGDLDSGYGCSDQQSFKGETRLRGLPSHSTVEALARGGESNSEPASESEDESFASDYAECAPDDATKSIHSVGAVDACMSFPEDFVFGAATCAYQIEGAAKEGGRLPSIWDEFCRKPRATVNGASGDVACDHYHRFRDDVAIMAQLGLRAYRFSISWSRLIPEGDGEVSEDGARFYSDLIDALRAANIEPWVTLYHWDMPQRLEEKIRGWLARKGRISKVFGNYARTCFSLFGDRVKHWMTINEPYCVAVMGYGLGVHAPGRTTAPATEPYIVGHNLLLAHAEAVRIYRSEFAEQRGQIGIVLNVSYKRAFDSSSELDVRAAQRSLDFELGWFAEPIFRGDYPERMRETCGERLPEFTEVERKKVMGSSDFLGLNFYFATFCSAPRPCILDRSSSPEPLPGLPGMGGFTFAGNEEPTAAIGGQVSTSGSCAAPLGRTPPSTGESKERHRAVAVTKRRGRRTSGGISAGSTCFADSGVILRKDPCWEKTDLGWYCTPWGLRELLIYAHQRYAPPGGLYITENGCAHEPDASRTSDSEPGALEPKPYDPKDAPKDDLTSGVFSDPERVRFLRNHLCAVGEALSRSVDVRGYFVWSLLDNFEWSEGYTSRFGIVRVDYETQKRTIKESGRFYAAVIRSMNMRRPSKDEAYKSSLRRPSISGYSGPEGDDEGVERGEQDSAP